MSLHKEPAIRPILRQPDFPLIDLFILAFWNGNAKVRDSINIVSADIIYTSFPEADDMPRLRTSFLPLCRPGTTKVLYPGILLSHGSISKFRIASTFKIEVSRSGTVQALPASVLLVSLFPLRRSGRLLILLALTLLVLGSTMALCLVEVLVELLLLPCLSL